MPAKSTCHQQKPIPSLLSMPNEIKAMIYQKMDFKTSLNARRCIRNFDKLSKMFSRRFPVDIRVKYTNMDLIEVELSDNNREGIENIITKWTFVTKARQRSKVVQKSWNNVVVFTKVVDGCENANAANTFVSNIFKKPIFEVKTLVLDMCYNEWLHITFELANWPIDQIVLKNCMDPFTTRTLIGSCTFNCRSFDVRYDDITRRKESVEFVVQIRADIVRVNRESRMRSIVNGYGEIEEMLNDAKSFEMAALTLRPFILSFTGFEEEQLDNSFLINWNKTIIDLMCIRAAFYTHPEGFFRSIEENTAETIETLREGIDNPVMGINVAAILSVVYLTKFDAPNRIRSQAYYILQYVIEDEMKLPQPNLYQLLTKKMERMLFGDRAPNTSLTRAPFSRLRYKK